MLRRLLDLAAQGSGKVTSSGGGCQGDVSWIAASFLSAEDALGRAGTGARFDQLQCLMDVKIPRITVPRAFRHWRCLAGQNKYRSRGSIFFQGDTVPKTASALLG